MATLTRNAVGPACGRRHPFSRPADGPTPPEYEFVCPHTGRPAVLDPDGHWHPAADPAPGTVALRPLGAAS